MKEKDALTNVPKSTTNGQDAARAGDFVCEQTVTLFAGQTINAGTVKVVTDGELMYITYTTANGWYLTQTHLYAGECGGIPVTGSGNPQPGQFPYAGTHNRLTTFTYVVPASRMGADLCGCIAAHAVVVKLNARGQVIQTETGWADGPRINPTGNWATRFNYCICTGT